MATLFIPREILPGETRVATNPDTVKRLVKEGHTVTVEAGAGEGAFIPDQALKDAGATVSSDVAALYGAADVVLKLHPPGMNEKAGKHEAEMVKEGAILVSFLWPLENLDAVKTLARRKVTAFAMDQMPRITRAQSMDALSSQANLAGYKAVVMAAGQLPKIFPLMMTPSGTIAPSKVVIMGAGVAGLQAIATAKRLGAVVEVSDVRPAVKEQVESLGGRFIEVPTDEAMETEGGYAKEATEDFLRKQREIVRKHVVEADVVITTALVPGKPAPKLISPDMVKEMRTGSVIVDLAAERGGNCELTEAGKTVVKEGVTIMGTLNIPGTVPFHASDMYAKNLHYVMQHLYPKGELNLDLEDEINAACVVTHAGEVRLPAVAERLKGGQ
jgi:NAD(P) transhydrogenase subunit alpha